jgi:D-glutamate cyclase
MSPRKSELDRKLGEIEALVCRDIGRRTRTLIEASRGDLGNAAASIAGATSVGLMTGFFVPRGETPAAETDGPVGTALLAAALSACGVPTRVAVDAPCIGVVRTCVVAAGGGAAIDEISDINGALGAWQQAGVSHAIAIERCGRSSDGRPRNMRGVDVSAWTLPLDDLYLGSSWTRVAIGDGGNEIGMGKLPGGLIARAVENGETIACVTPCDHLIVAGVSNWGAYGLMAALAVLKPNWSETIAKFLTAELDAQVTRAAVEEAGAIDGVTARREATVDGFGPAVHAALIEDLRRIAWGTSAD